MDFKWITLKNKEIFKARRSLIDDSLEDIKKNLQDQLQKDSDTYHSKYQRKSRRRRPLIWRIISGIYFIEPRTITFHKIFLEASTGDILLIRQTPTFYVAGVVDVPPEVLIGMKYTTSGSYQSKKKSMELWNHIGIVVVYKFGQKYLLYCGPDGVELRPLQEVLDDCDKRVYSCALRKLSFHKTLSNSDKKENILASLVYLAGLVQRGLLSWPKVFESKGSQPSVALEQLQTDCGAESSPVSDVAEREGENEAEETEADVLQTSHQPQQYTSLPSFKKITNLLTLPVCLSMINMVLERVQSAVFQISEEQINAARGRFVDLCKTKRDLMREAELLKEVERKGNESSKKAEGKPQASVAGEGVDDAQEIGCVKGTTDCPAAGEAGFESAATVKGDIGQSALLPLPETGKTDEGDSAEEGGTHAGAMCKAGVEDDNQEDAEDPPASGEKELETPGEQKPSISPYAEGADVLFLAYEDAVSAFVDLLGGSGQVSSDGDKQCQSPNEQAHLSIGQKLLKCIGKSEGDNVTAEEYITALTYWIPRAVPPDVNTYGFLMAEFVACVYDKLGLLSLSFHPNQCFFPSSFCSRNPDVPATLNPLASKRPIKVAPAVPNCLNVRSTPLGTDTRYEYHKCNFHPRLGKKVVEFLPRTLLPDGVYLEPEVVHW